MFYVTLLTLKQNTQNKCNSCSKVSRELSLFLLFGSKTIGLKLGYTWYQLQSSSLVISIDLMIINHYIMKNKIGIQLGTKWAKFISNQWIGQWLQFSMSSALSQILLLSSLQLSPLHNESLALNLLWWENL